MARIVKRALDVAVSLIGLLVLSPLLLVLALIVRLTMGSPVLFRQDRPGLGGSVFTMLKFRTMRDALDRQGRPLPDEERLTKAGQLLRSTSLDELPELLNVLKGEMSLVGPRPLLTEYLSRYTPQQARRHEVKPGITGWAQVNGRNAVSWEQKFQYDVWYVDNWSLWLDARILWLTAWTVLKREGVSQQGMATVEKFTGSQAPEPEEAGRNP
jgi:lipopolysaccharide/colanic/teichoic acid biosynthesis glycosyltransferase